MPILTGCCCFASLKTGSRASAIFSIPFFKESRKDEQDQVTGIVNIAIDIAALIRMTYASENMIPQEFWLYFPPGIIPLIYIELVFSVALIALGIILLIGINYQFDGKSFITAWVVGMSLDRIYDFFLGIYTLVWIGGHRFSDVVYVIPECIVVAVYWILNSCILLAAILCVISYWQDLQDDLFGKERRMKYYSKLANIRAAALSGVNTPFKSYYSSRSMLLLNQSQASVNPSFQAQR